MTFLFIYLIYFPASCFKQYKYYWISQRKNMPLKLEPCTQYFLPTFQLKAYTFKLTPVNKFFNIQTVVSEFLGPTKFWMRPKLWHLLLSLNIYIRCRDRNTYPITSLMFNNGALHILCLIKYSSCFSSSIFAVKSAEGKSELIDLY